MTPVLDEAMIRALVHGFYARVRADAELGPIFARAIKDWDPHLATMCDFWSSVMLSSGRYKGRPVPAHHKHGDRIVPEHFERWLAIWNATTAELMTPAAAQALQAAAARIGESLKLALFFTLNSHPGRTHPDHAERGARQLPGRWRDSGGIPGRQWPDFH